MSAMILASFPGHRGPRRSRWEITCYKDKSNDEGHLKPFLRRAAKSLAQRAPLVRDWLQERDRLRRELDEARRKLAPREWEKPAYAIWGEDQILAWVFENRSRGFYVDVGAFHPSLHSNTKLLFDRGWTGINIDCNPAIVDWYRHARPRDVSLNLAVGNRDGPVKVFVFNDWAPSNTISSAWAEATRRVQATEVPREIEVPCHPLRTILERHLPAGTSIDFLN